MAFDISVLPWEVGTIRRRMGQADGAASITVCLKSWVWKDEIRGTMHPHL